MDDDRNIVFGFFRAVWELAHYLQKKAPPGPKGRLLMGLFYFCIPIFLICDLIILIVLGMGFLEQLWEMKFAQFVDNRKAKKASRVS